MAEWTGVRRLRDNLTEYVIRVATHGDEVVVWSRGRAVARLRPVEATDIWARTARPTVIPITQFRHHISEFLRRAAQAPLVVTWHDQPQVWVGPPTYELDDAPTRDVHVPALSGGLSNPDEAFGVAADH